MEELWVTYIKIILSPGASINLLNFYFAYAAIIVYLLYLTVTSLKLIWKEMTIITNNNEVAPAVK